MLLNGMNNNSTVLGRNKNGRSLCFSQDSNWLFFTHLITPDFVVLLLSNNLLYFSDLYGISVCNLPMSISNSACLFFNLPFEVVGEILGDWLELRSFVDVDSAVCNHSNRQVLLKLFASMSCTQRRTVELNTDSCAWWFIKRKVPITRVALTAASQEISICLRLQSKNILRVDCTDSEAIDLVAMDCRNLTVCVCKNVVAKPHLNAALAYNVKLQALRLENVKELQVSHFDHVHLPHLQVLSLYATSCDDALLCAILSTTHELQHLNIQKCKNITDEGLIATAKHCPQLRSIGLDGLQITDAGLEQLTKLCPLIDNLKLSDNALITDSGLHFVAKNLTKLRTLQIWYCNITDLSLEHLALHCKAALQILYVIDIEEIRVDVLVLLLQQCQQLRNLVLDCDIEPYCAEVVPYMNNLQSLLLYSVLSDDCLCLIARHCKQLHHLGIPSTYKVDCDLATAANESALDAGVGDVRVLYCANEETTKDDIEYTETGLLALVDGLSNLQRLYCPAVSADDEENTLLHIMVQRMWQRLRPALRFEQKDDFFYQNTLDDDDAL